MCLIKNIRIDLGKAGVCVPVVVLQQSRGELPL